MPRAISERGGMNHDRDFLTRMASKKVYHSISRKKNPKNVNLIPKLRSTPFTVMWKVKLYLHAGRCHPKPIEEHSRMTLS
jgi:hypothetical protein